MSLPFYDALTTVILLNAKKAGVKIKTPAKVKKE
jgi:hypothetical protein